MLCDCVFFHSMRLHRRTVSAIQAILSSSAGYIVCRSSCRQSSLTASHFMSDGYAWFGAAYFIYDMWYMYKVYSQKLNDKAVVQAANGQPTEAKESRSDGNGNCLAAPRNISFLQFCIDNPVMIVHHTFLGSFGLLVIVVCVFIYAWSPLLSIPSRAMFNFIRISVFAGQFRRLRL